MGMPGVLGRILSYGESLEQTDCGLREPRSRFTYGSVDGALLFYSCVLQQANAIVRASVA